ncbi:MAG TPA: Type 1 glutamine amidotransferase-like domain-containing protein [Rhizomicrobium sp.]|nr:Type 1 glutamine amidotransferase-like domain-containing protein [Rhizomicrobium sp.]
MRLYLSSYRFGDRIDLLLDMVGKGARAGVISNAVDAIPKADRETYRRTVHDPAAELRAHGLDVTDLDLRDHFGRPDTLEEALGKLDLVWVVGGNTFLLRRAMRQSGFDRLIGKSLENDRFVYGGFSAGAIVACPSLRGIELMDEPHRLAEGYDPEVIWDGLNLIAFHIVPHYESDHPESEAAGRVTAWMLDQAMPYRTMRDGDVLIRDASGVRAYERESP